MTLDGRPARPRRRRASDPPSRDLPRADPRARRARLATCSPESAAMTPAPSGSRSSSVAATGTLPANTMATGQTEREPTRCPSWGPSLRRYYPEQVRRVGGGRPAQPVAMATLSARLTRAPRRCCSERNRSDPELRFKISDCSGMRRTKTPINAGGPAFEPPPPPLRAGPPPTSPGVRRPARGSGRDPCVCGAATRGSARQRAPFLRAPRR